MTPEIAAKIVEDGSFSGQDLDELYDALYGKKEYAALFSKLLIRIEDQVQLNMKNLQDAALAARSLEKLDAEAAQKEVFDEESLQKLNNLAFTEKKEIKGKVGNFEITGKARRQDTLDMVKSAVRMATLTELRGMTPGESAAARDFRRAGSEEEKRRIYQQTLKSNLDYALIEMALGHETVEQIQQVADKDLTGEEAEKEYGKLLGGTSKAFKDTFEAIGKLGKKGKNADGKEGIVKLRVGQENAAAYCARVLVQSEGTLKSYKKDIANRVSRIESYLGRLASKESEKTKKVWNEGKESILNAFVQSNLALEKSFAVLEEKGRKACGAIWEVAKKTAQSAWDNRKQIATDIGAAMGYSAALGSGMTGLIIVGAAGYAGYTVWRRVIKPYKELKSKGKPVDAKFIIKASTGVIAAVLSGGAGVVAGGLSHSAGSVVAEQLAATRLTRALVTSGGAVSANLAGAAQAAMSGDKKTRNQELRSAALVALTSLGTAWLSSRISEWWHGNSGHEDALNNGSAGQQTDVSHSGGERQADAPVDSSDTGNADTNTGVEDNQDNSGIEDNQPADDQSNSDTATPETDYPWDFPDENPANSGITDDQFENLRRIMGKYSAGDEEVMDRMYHNAAANAAALSVDADNPLTPEQVLFKFFRASAWTNHERSNGWAFSETGAFGKELKAIFDTLGCDDEMSAEMQTRAAAVLGTIRSNGSMDAAAAFKLCPELAKYNEVAADGSIAGKTDAVLVGMHKDPCAEDKEVEFAHSGARQVQHEVEHEPEVEEVQREVQREEIGDTSQEDRYINREEAAPVVEKVTTRAAAPVQEENIGIGVGSNEGDDNGLAGAQDAAEVAAGKDVGDYQGNSGSIRRMARKLLKIGGISESQHAAINSKLNGGR